MFNHVLHLTIICELSVEPTTFELISCFDPYQLCCTNNENMCSTSQKTIVFYVLCGIVFLGMAKLY